MEKQNFTIAQLLEYLMTQIKNQKSQEILELLTFVQK